MTDSSGTNGGSLRGDVHDGDVPDIEVEKGGVEVIPGGKTILRTKRPDMIPDEGFRGWLCVFGAFICLFCSFGFLNA